MTSSGKTLGGLAFVAALLFCLHVFSDNKADVDLWGNVGFVRAPAWSPEFHYTNTFAFTEPRHEWINHEWLSEYILHSVHKSFGNAGLLALKILLGLCITLVMYSSVRRECSSVAVRFLLMILIVSTMGYGFSTRPHLFTYLLYACLLAALRYWPASGRMILIAAPLAGFLWANLHGAFFIAILTMAIYLVSVIILSREGKCPYARLGQLGLAIVAFAAASLLNPYGTRLWAFIRQSAALPRPWLSEWAPFNPLEHAAIHPDFIALALISLAAVAFSARREWPWVILLAVAFISSIVLRRNIPLFAITAAFVVPRCADDVASAAISRLSTASNRAIATACILLLAAASAWGAISFNKAYPAQIEVPGSRFPAGIIAGIRESRLSGNALVFFDWAEYSIWHNFPECRQFMDGRFSDAYSPRTIEDYFNFLYLGPDWENALTKYPTDILLLHKGSPVYAMMYTRPDWALVAQDNIAALFLKRAVHADTITGLATNSSALFSRHSNPTFFPD